MSIQLHIQGTPHAPWLKKHLLAVLRHLKVQTVGGGWSITVVRDAAMKALHARSMNIPTTTDVLTFDLREETPKTQEGSAVELDTVICIDEARRHARELGHPVKHELLLYALHSLLHVQGFDDAAPRRAAAMHRREDELLVALGIGRVYGKPVEAGENKAKAPCPPEILQRVRSTIDIPELLVNSLLSGGGICRASMLPGLLAQATIPEALTTEGRITGSAVAVTFLVATLGSLLFSTLSYALRTISRVQLEEALVVRRRTRALEDILRSRFDLALSASILRLVCNTVGILAIGAYFLLQYYNQPHPLKVFGWTVLVTVPVMMIFSVAIPQAWAKYAGEPLLAFCWPLLKLALWLTWPLVRALNVFDEIVKRLAGVSIGDEPETAAEKVEEEILSVVAEGTAGGAVDEEQKKMIEGVISFRDLQVGQIMTPRTEIIAVDVNMPVLEVRDRILNDGLSRVPVYEGTLDNIVGIVNAKDLLQFVNIAGGSAGEDDEMQLRKIIRRPLFVPRTKPLRDLLKEFRVQGHHMAVVLDEYGGTSGLVTTEDIVEQIVGDIVDEYEHAEPQELRLKRIDERTVEVDARMYVSDLNRELNLAIPEDGDFQTVGGFVISTLGIIPVNGDHLEHEGAVLTVLEAEPRRIRRLKIELPGPASGPAEKGEPVTAEAR